MRKLRIIAISAATAVILAATGCASSPAPAEEPATSSSEETAEAEVVEEKQEEDSGDFGSNPASKIAGAYSDEGGSGFAMLIVPIDNVDGVFVTIGYPQEDSYSFWEMNGKMADNVITYTDGSKNRREPEEPDDILEYSDGTGSITISADNKLTWKDDKENAGEGLVFVWDQELSDQITQMKEESGSDDGGLFTQSVKNWAGPYSDRENINRTMTITAAEESDTECSIVITEDTSETMTTTWTMTGVYNDDSLTIDYSDCVKKESEIDSDGNVIAEKVIYSDGTGTLTINDEDQTVEWSDEVDDAGNGSLFVFSYTYENADNGDTLTSDDAGQEDS